MTLIQDGITFEHVTKRYRSNLVLDDVTAAVRPGRITGLLGPNGSGKSTLLKILLGLARSDSGQALIDGQPIHKLSFPVQRVGALVDASWTHPHRSALNHLQWIARASDLPIENAARALTRVGLAEVAGRHVGKFSLGMKQRLGIAATVLGDPSVLVFDEPLNGLDQSGVQFVREFLLGEAQRGRTVLLASHLLPEMALVADDLLVLGRGSLLYAGSAAEFVRDNAASVDVVFDPARVNPEKVQQLVVARGWSWVLQPANARGAVAIIRGASVAEVMTALFEVRDGITGVSEGHSLEDRYLQLTSSATQFPMKAGRQ